MRVYYFGCWEKHGHFLWTRHKTSLPLVEIEALPARLGMYALDQAFCPYVERDRRGAAVDEAEQQSVAELHHVDGYTVIGFWDRTGDTRPGSNSAFIAEGLHRFDGMRALAAVHFPALWERINAAAAVTLASGSSAGVQYNPQGLPCECNPTEQARWRCNKKWLRCNMAVNTSRGPCTPASLRFTQALEVALEAQRANGDAVTT